MDKQELFRRHDDDEPYLSWGEIKRYHELRRKAAGSEPGYYGIFKRFPTALIDEMNNGLLPRGTRIYRKYLVMGPGAPRYDVEDWFREDTEVDEFYVLRARAEFAATGSIFAFKWVMDAEENDA